jgi:hypothetical protein
MNASTTMERATEMSPKRRARLVGLLLLLTMVGGGFAEGYVGEQLISGSASATATRIVAEQSLYRLAFAIYLVEMACQIAMTVLLYGLLKPVSRTAAALAAVFGLVGCTIKTLGRVFFFSPLLLLGGADYLGSFDPKQLEAVAFLALRLDYTVETIAVVFFGMANLLEGWLMFRSTFLPRVLGVISVVGGLGWMLYLYEPMARRLQGYIVGFGVLGALAMVSWLLVKGVDEARWNQLNKEPAR